MAPIMAYLILLGVQDQLPYDWRWLAALLRGAGGLGAYWLLRRKMPPWGRAHVALAAGCGLLAAALWFYGQYLFDALGVPRVLPIPLFSAGELIDPRTKLADPSLFWVSRLGADAVFWMDVGTRIAVAAVGVPVVEELFWRVFLLRALADWQNFEKLPLGHWSPRSFWLTSLISTIQHPANWAVSIPCWMLFNGLMIWRKSLLFLVLVHGFTNLFLYAWVIWRAVAWHDASVWMFW